jgi:ketosteroid isomerase-like protein
MTAASHDAHDAVRSVVAAINAVWHVAEPDAITRLLEPYFAADMTIVGPGFAPMAGGREAAVASYADFARIAKISAFEMDEPVIHADGDTAVATFAWRIRYTMDGTGYDERGHDVFVLRRHGERWLATWRAMLPDAAQ